MKAVLIGTDYLQQGDDVKVLEINTNAAIYNDGVDMLDFTSLFTTLNTNNITEFHYIFTEGASAVPIGEPNKFKNKLQELCQQNNIEFNEYEVPKNSITVPDIEDGDNKFILRQAYDTSALLDSLYTADKFKFFSLMSESSYIPKTYFSSSDDSLVVDTLDSVDYTLTDHPNLVEKERYPQYNRDIYPKLSILPDSAALQSKKDNVESSVRMLQEFVYDTKSIIDGYWSVIRSFQIVYGSSLDIIDLGGYNHSAPAPLSFNENEFQDGTYDLDNRSRAKYLNKNLDRDQPIAYHTDEESIILMIDGTLENVSTISESDVIKTVTFDVNYDSTASSSLFPWQDASTLEDVSSSLEFVSSSLISKEEQNISTFMVAISLDSGEVWNDTAGTTYYIEESGSTDTRFENVNKLYVGDKIITINKNTSELSKKEIIGLELVFQDNLNIYALDFEPSDYFLVDIGSDDFTIMHNVCTGCSWSGCGDYWCDYSCIGCSGGPGGKF